MTNATNANSAAPKLALANVPNNASPMVDPKSIKGGDKGTKAETSKERAETLNAWAVKALETNASNVAAKALVKAQCQTAVADYYKALEDTKALADGGDKANEVVEEAKQGVARAYADAILANVFDRSEARNQLGVSFGFEVSDKTGKVTSKPVEPGNTIAKRVSSVTIAAEYAMTGQLPERGGESLHLVGQADCQELLADYFAGEITVRAASERIEKAIREARISVPLEMDADKLIRFAGKIQTASDSIAGNPELMEAYSALFQIIASIPFPVEEAKAA